MIVLETTRAVMARAAHVTLDSAAISSWARSVTAEELRPKDMDLLANIPGDRGKIANLILLIDALNFCFWSSDPIRAVWNGRRYHRYEAMLASILLAARREPRWCTAQFWLEVDSKTLRAALAAEGELLMMEERERTVRETARTLLDRFDGQFVNAIESVNEQAWPLAVLLMTNFDSFRDVAAHRGQPVYFMKRAQICAFDMAMAWQLAGHAALEGLEQLTAFADYRVPQALRRLEILRVAPGLAERIEREEELPAGCEEEVEIRAATVQAVEAMRIAVAEAGKAAPAWQIDCYLWRLARTAETGVKHHRTRTIFY